MFLSLAFAGLIIVVVLLKYLVSPKERCPQCQAVRQDGAPLCSACSWIYDLPDDEDDDYGEAEEYVDEKIL